jgi:hypothetical protein
LDTIRTARKLLYPLKTVCISSIPTTIDFHWRNFRIFCPILAGNPCEWFCEPIRLL